MIKIDNVVLPSGEQWMRIIQGTRNPKNSWDRSDSDYRRILCDRCDNCLSYQLEQWEDCDNCEVDIECKTHDGFMIGPNDHKLMASLASGGPVHAKYRRMIMVYLDITAPLYWWKEYDTYKVGTVANSCSTMHKIHEKEFTLDDFSCEHLMEWSDYEDDVKEFRPDRECNFKFYMLDTISALNNARDLYLLAKTKPMKDESKRAGLVKKFWWQMIQLLPSSYNQKRTVMLNYEVLHNIYISRKNHKLDEWHTFCDWIRSLPYSELITGEI